MISLVCSPASAALTRPNVDLNNRGALQAVDGMRVFFVDRENSPATIRVIDGPRTKARTLVTFPSNQQITSLDAYDGRLAVTLAAGSVSGRNVSATAPNTAIPSSALTMNADGSNQVSRASALAYASPNSAPCGSRLRNARLLDRGAVLVEYANYASVLDDAPCPPLSGLGATTLRVLRNGQLPQTVYDDNAADGDSGATDEEQPTGYVTYAATRSGVDFAFQSSYNLRFFEASSGRAWSWPARGGWIFDRLDLSGSGSMIVDELRGNRLRTLVFPVFGARAGSFVLKSPRGADANASFCGGKIIKTYYSPEKAARNRRIEEFTVRGKFITTLARAPRRHALEFAGCGRTSVLAHDWDAETRYNGYLVKLPK